MNVAKRLRVLTAVLFALAMVVIVTVNGAGALGHPSYRLNNAKFCKSHYVKRNIKVVQAVRVKVQGKWIIEHKSVRLIECVYVPPVINSTVTTTTAAPVTTTTAAPVTTTTATSVTTTTAAPVTTTTAAPVSTTTIYDQATTIIYNSFSSYTQVIGSRYYATEYAELTITGLSLSPAAGTVDFYDGYGIFICSGNVDANYFQTTVTCEGMSLATNPVMPIRDVYSGTQFGYNDGHGASYAGSSS